MHDAQLNAGFRVDRLNGFGETLEPIDTGNEDVLHAAVLKLGHHLQPELRPFGLGDPQAQHFLVAGEVDPDRQVHRLHPHGPGITDLDVDTVEIQNRIQRVQWARLPGLHFLAHRVGDRGDETRGYLGAIHLGEMPLDFPYGHAAGIERHDLSSKPAQRVWCLPMSCGSKAPWRSRGMSSGNSPNSPLSVFALCPLRALPEALTTGSLLSWPRCSAISVSRARSTSILVSGLSRPFSPIRSSGFL